MVSLEQAQERILAETPTLAAECVSLARAGGRVLSQDIQAPIDLPIFDNSAMDGYAVQASDTARADRECPIGLILAARLPAGQPAEGRLQRGHCMRLFTGSALPAGADAVVMQEETRLDPGQPDRILVLGAVSPGENVRWRGEDVKQGVRLLSSGERLQAGGVALLGAVGLGQVAVTRQPVVGLVSTGSELIEPGQPLRPGKIYESNRLALGILAERTGALPRMYPLVPDGKEAIERTLRRAFQECDVVVSSGGVSVGELDLVKESFEGIGGRLDFWKVALKPGKPFVFGRWQEKFWFGLPGNPVSALVTFLLFVRPVLLRLQGCARVALPLVPGTLVEPLENGGDRRHFVRVYRSEDGAVRLSGAQSSHVLHSLAGANGLVDVPPGSRWSAGTAVTVMLF